MQIKFRRFWAENAKQIGEYCNAVETLLLFLFFILNQLSVFAKKHTLNNNIKQIYTW